MPLVGLYLVAGGGCGWRLSNHNGAVYTIGAGRLPEGLPKPVVDGDSVPQERVLRNAAGAHVGYGDGSEISFRLDREAGVVAAAVDGGPYSEMLRGLPPGLGLQPWLEWDSCFKGGRGAFVKPDLEYPGAP